MKAVLISIQPKWVEKIANGEKTIEVRKSAPKEVPFKAYIYETKGATETPWADEDGHLIFKGRGQVIGEFICDKVYEWECKNRLELVGELGLPNWRASYMIFVDDLEKTCLTSDDLWEYGKGKSLYGWRIADLKIYDKPRELSEFFRICKNPCKPQKGKILCMTTKSLKMNGCNGKIHLTRAPQSWQYVEEL